MSEKSSRKERNEKTKRETTRQGKHRRIRVKSRHYEMPFSRGVLARSLTAIGVEPHKAYEIALKIKEELQEEGIDKISTDELADIIRTKLEEIDETLAERYELWRRIKKREEPIIVLIGGASGVGTSTIASEVGHRLGITNVIGTDAIREVMRRVLAEELYPTLYESSYTAWKRLRYEPAEDPVITGFLDHSEPVVVGIEGVVNRSINEGIHVIVEGVHIVPRLIKREILNYPNVFVFMLSVEDEEAHKWRFYARSRDTKLSRPAERYLKYFEEIRRIHDFLVEDAEEHDIPVINNEHIDETVDQIVSYISSKLLKGERELSKSVSWW
ncbi:MULTISPECIES: 2-phosphoglycerate kinase [unclassified Methanopyrus]|uniref:2-phosphoglycerate kinase n=1 Tax=Methanopyrus sp. SNP6 TaxID=1937005 RepID=UPI0011E5EFF3|nr:2-phosphoglycerate kinase [Methanopyrus sp. SNP6]